MGGAGASNSSSRRSFVASCLGVSGAFAASLLSGCSFSLRDFLESPARIYFGQSESANFSPSASSQDLPYEVGSSTTFPASEGKQYGFWMDASSCIGCGSCVSACREASCTPENAEGRRRLLLYEMAHDEKRFVSLSCLHCAEPACVRVCPAGAVTKRADGIVVVDREACIGCRYCRQACPFDVPRYRDGVMDKCDYCLGAGIAPGRQPHCVKSCPSGALKHGTMDDLLDFSKGLASPVAAPTGPSLLVS